MATTLNISESIWKKCCPHVVEDYDRCAGITVCSLKPVMPDEWDTYYLSGGMPRVDSALAEADFIGKACIPTINGLYEWISATRRQYSRSNLGSRRRMDGLLEYEPFLKMHRKGPINNQWWKAVYGGTGATEVPQSHKYVVTSLSDGIPANPNWFPAGMQVFLSSLLDAGGSVNGSAVVGQTEFVGDDLTIWVVPTPGGTLPGVGQTTNTTAVLTRGIVNVTDYEEWCEQIPALNTKQEVLFWVGTTRYTICESELQNQFIQRALRDNPLYREYMHVPEVEYTRQITTDFQRRMVEQFFYGRALNSYQNEDQWNLLPEIKVDFGSFLGPNLPDQGACVGRRANPVGIMPQLADCNRVIDGAGAALDLAKFFEHIYYMQRVRADNGVSSNVFEVCMNSAYAILFQTAMIKYYKARTVDTLAMNWDLGAQKQGPFGFYFRDFVLDFPAGTMLRVVTHPFFDDWLDAHNRAGAAIRNQGNVMWMLDWSTIYQAIISSNSVTNSTGDINDLAKLSKELACTMKVAKTTYRHTSTTFTNVVECPDASLAYRNLGMVEPVATGTITKVGIGAVPWDNTLECSPDVDPHAELKEQAKAEEEERAKAEAEAEAEAEAGGTPSPKPGTPGAPLKGVPVTTKVEVTRSAEATKAAEKRPSKQ